MNKRSKKRGRSSFLDLEERLNKQQYFIAKAARGHNKDCMVCSKPQSRKATLFYCKTCVKKPGLHPSACFKAYHTQENYKQNCLLPFSCAFTFRVFLPVFCRLFHCLQCMLFVEFNYKTKNATDIMKLYNAQNLQHEQYLL